MEFHETELFLCSKVWTTTIEQGSDAIRAQVQQTLDDLQTDYIDLYLIHWPVPGKHVQAYQTLLELQTEGKIRGVGVSNYAWEDWLELKEAGVTQAPLVNQIEINPFLYRKNTISKFESEGVVMQSYRSLRDGKAFDDPGTTRDCGSSRQDVGTNSWNDGVYNMALSMSQRVSRRNE